MEARGDKVGAALDLEVEVLSHEVELIANQQRHYVKHQA